jgi:hypothetical protein
MRFGVRELVYIGIFGALWGAAELSLGAALHTFNVPFTGAIMSALGMLIALIGRSFVPRRGTVLFISLVTALLKMLSLGGIVITPMIGIVAEGMLAEAGLLLAGQPRRGSYALAGALATFWAFIHPFFTQGLLAGVGILQVYGWTVGKGAKLLGLDPSAVALILAALVAIHLGIGAVAGLLAWDVGRAVRARVGPSPS